MQLLNGLDSWNVGPKCMCMIFERERERDVRAAYLTSTTVRHPWMHDSIRCGGDKPKFSNLEGINIMTMQG